MPTPHILLVEDNPGDVLLFRKALRREGIDLLLEIATDGVEALERLSRTDLAAPDLLLLDLNMPRISGIEVLRQLRLDPVVHAAPMPPQRVRVAHHLPCLLRPESQRR